MTPMSKKEGLASLIIVHLWMRRPVYLLQEPIELSHNGLKIHRGVSLIDDLVDSCHQALELFTQGAVLQLIHNLYRRSIRSIESIDVLQEIPR